LDAFAQSWIITDKNGIARQGLCKHMAI